jgi:60 kDa SS-A/Ro ribonucleoprotein
MANKELFGSGRSPRAAAVNDAGGAAYKLSSEEALAQFAATGCFQGTFYASAEKQLERVKALVSECRPEFVAKVAMYGRRLAFMKDMPAFMLAHLHAIGEIELLKWAWPNVIDNGRMLRNFAQIVRSGVLGRKSFGHAAKRLIQGYLLDVPPEKLFRDSVGQDPSIADVIKMAHAWPRDNERRALFGYLIDREPEKWSPACEKDLPQIVKDFELFKKNMELPIPNVEFRMLTALNLGVKEWIEIARNAPWHMTRMNLNTFARHGVFDNPEMVQIVANRLRDREIIEKVMVFPYQLMMAYTAVMPARTGRGYYRDAGPQHDMPREIIEALHDAMEIATEKVPTIMKKRHSTSEGGILIPDIRAKILLAVDTSGSMSSPVTGRSKTPSRVRCVDVAGLIASCILRKNPDAKVWAFDTQLHVPNLDPRDTVMTNAQKLAAYGGGGTNCSLALHEANRQRLKADVVIYVSDYESWADRGYYGGTGMQEEWQRFKRHNPGAKLVCIDLTPRENAQVMEKPDTLHVGGFSDVVFTVIDQFLQAENPKHWVDLINQLTVQS